MDQTQSMLCYLLSQANFTIFAHIQISLAPPLFANRSKIGTLSCFGPRPNQPKPPLTSLPRHLLTRKNNYISSPLNHMVPSLPKFPLYSIGFHLLSNIGVKDRHASSRAFAPRQSLILMQKYVHLFIPLLIA